MHFPEGKLFPSAGIGEIRRGGTARRGADMFNVGDNVKQVAVTGGGAVVAGVDSTCRSSLRCLGVSRRNALYVAEGLE